MNNDQTKWALIIMEITNLVDREPVFEDEKTEILM